MPDHSFEAAAAIAREEAKRKLENEMFEAGIKASLAVEDELLKEKHEYNNRLCAAMEASEEEAKEAAAAEAAAAEAAVVAVAAAEAAAAEAAVVAAAAAKDIFSMRIFMLVLVVLGAAYVHACRS